MVCRLYQNTTQWDAESEYEFSCRWIQWWRQLSTSSDGNCTTWRQLLPAAQQKERTSQSKAWHLQFTWKDLPGMRPNIHLEDPSKRQWTPSQRPSKSLKMTWRWGSMHGILLHISHACLIHAKSLIERHGNMYNVNGCLKSLFWYAAKTEKSHRRDSCSGKTCPHWQAKLRLKSVLYTWVQGFLQNCDLQVRGSEYNSQRSQLGQVSRKQTGSLAVKDLGSIISEKDVINTENLITLFVVVPRHQTKEWLSSYESITEYIVSSFVFLHIINNLFYYTQSRLSQCMKAAPSVLLAVCMN